MLSKKVTQRSFLKLRRSGQRYVTAGLMVLAVLASFGLQLGSPNSRIVSAATVNLTVEEYGTNTPIPEFDFLVNIDNTGDPDDPGNMPSTTPMESHSPVVLTGDETDWAAKLGTLPDGRYLISVRNDAYKLGGQHFTVAGGNVDIHVELVPEPLPLAKIRVHAFEDNQPVNGEDDIPLESGLAGFRVIVGDTVGEVVVDWFGNPICGTGQCLTDANGDVVIDNLPRGKYEVLVLPPVGQVSDWVQTTTIEGTKVIDAWIVEGDPGYSPREGFQQAAVWVGFVRQPANPWGGNSGSGTIKGTVKTIIEWTPPVNPLILGQPVDRPWVAVTDIGGNDELVYLTRGDANGYFEINGVPDGTYQLAIWDEPLDYIIAFRTAVVSGGNVVDFGELGIPRWFGWQSGYVYLDANRDGVRQLDEQPLPGVDLAMRFRDGSLRYGTFTNTSGYYEFPEVFELEKFYISEVGFRHLGFTSALVHDEHLPYDPADPATYEVIPEALTVANLNWAAKRNVVDWGKYVYAPGENGGISGIVQYATTRNELEARLQATEDYEPGIPDVTVRLWEPLFDENGDPVFEPDGSQARGTLFYEVTTDRYEHPTDCDVTDSNGVPLPDPLGTGPNCIEVPNISNEVKPGVFDGGYAFATICPMGYPCDPGDEIPMPPGDYIVEVVPPTGYKIVTEEDLNTADGNDYVPAIPPPPCVGATQLMQVPDEYGSPFDAFTDTGDPIPGVGPMPLCDFKLVTLQENQNAAADFYLMTDNAVPIPGRVFGFLLDDLNIETNSAFIYYGEKRGIPNTPVGVYDFTGRLITTVNSDQNGIWEVLLPSAYAADCPIPSGVCPAVYKFVGNDPGPIDNPNPNYNPNYQTITFQFDVWPGKTTFADIALFNIVGFVEFPGLQTGQPAQCKLPDSIPQVYTVSPPYGADGDALTISGVNFGGSPGTVALDGTALPIGSWSDAAITATATGVAPGPHQLLVTTAAGETSLTGITYHLLGPGYSPTVVIVSQPGDPSIPVIQNAIDAASGETLIVVEPGTYYQPVNLNVAGVKLQGYGPGNPAVGIGGGGSVLDQRFVVGGVNGLNVVGPAGGFNPGFPAQIDGFKLTAARDEQDVGGGLHVDLNAQNLLIGNNLIQSNGGNFGGGITIGEPYRGDNNNDNIRIAYNRILQNGGISLAGGIGIFNGADHYEIDHNQICGNYSGEYGGGISHFGYSQGGSIHHNQIIFNGAFDEGGGVLIGGEQPIPPAVLTQGSGEVQIFNNLIQSNLSNDDGGGIRLLQPLDDRIDIFNNMVVNNVATDIGGGIALDDSSNVTIVNNTVARNVSTATAEDSDGLAHGAGIVAEAHSAAFQAILPLSDPGYPDPALFNNIVCENEAFVWDGVSLVSTGFFDLEVFSANPAQVFHPTYTLVETTGRNEVLAHGSNSGCGDLSAMFVNPYTTALDAVSFRQEPDFITVLMVTVDLPATVIGDYHILSASGTEDLGIDVDPLGSGTLAPCFDFDDDLRGTHDIGADETGGAPGVCSPPVPTYGVDLTPIFIDATGADGADVVLSHQVFNTGDISDTYDITVAVDLGWPAVFTTPVGPLDPGESAAVDVTVSIPAGTLAGTAAAVDITATSQGDGSVSSAASDTITVVNVPVVPPADLYLSVERNTAVLGNLSQVFSHDIVGFVQGTGEYVMVFDGSDVGLGQNLNLDAFDILGDGSILMSFAQPFNRAGLGRVDDSDILRFTPDVGGLGDATAGAFTRYLNGADVGLTTDAEDIDAISLIEGDQLVISTLGNVNVPGLAVQRDEDLLLYSMLDAGNPGGGGTWTLYFDGSDVGLANGGADENIDGAFVLPGDLEAAVIYLTTAGNFNIPGLTGADEDVFTCAVSSLGEATACTSVAMFFDGNANGITNATGRDVDAIDLP